ncbi:hypothetical protein Tco_1446330 [Tanacetum coccineum]
MLCGKVKKLTQEVGHFKFFEELNVTSTTISYLPILSISLLKGLRLVGSRTLIESCDLSTEIQSSDDGTFFWIFLALGWLLEEIHVTWLNWRRNGQDYDSTPVILKKFTQSMETASQTTRDGARMLKRWRHGFLRQRQNITASKKH